MSLRTDVLLWAQRVLAMADAPPHKLLDVMPMAPPDVVSDAFQKIARVNHPDLHRGGLTPEELEKVTAAYSRVANAYQEMRTGRAAKVKPIGDPSSIVAQRLSGNIKAQTPSAGVPVTDAAATPSSGVAAHSMNSKALIYYRKAENALRRGDLRGGVLQIKMAIAADPQSVFLRTVLSEIEAEGAKKP